MALVVGMVYKAVARRDGSGPGHSESMGQIGFLGLQGWEGLTWTPVTVVGATKAKYRIQAVVETKLAGRSRWIAPGEVTLVPKGAIRFERPRTGVVLDKAPHQRGSLRSGPTLSR